MSIIKGEYILYGGVYVVKGTQRQMVMVRTSESNLFEMAYFVLRADSDKKTDRRSMIDEANSIVHSVCADGVRSKEEKRLKKGGRIALFIAGMLFGVLSAIILGLLFFV